MCVWCRKGCPISSAPLCHLTVARCPPPPVVQRGGERGGVTANLGGVNPQCY